MNGLIAVGIFKVKVPEVSGIFRLQIGKIEIVSGNHGDGVLLRQMGEDALGRLMPVMGIGAAKDFVD